MGGFDEARGFGIVGKRLADLADGDFEHRIADKRVVPDRSDQVLFGHELSRLRHEVFEHGERLGPELYGFRTPQEALVHPIE